MLKSIKMQNIRRRGMLVQTFRLPFALTALLLVAAILWNTLRSELSQP